MSNKPNKQKEEKDALKKSMLKTIKEIDTSQLANEKLDEEKVNAKAEDLEPSEFTSGTDAMADGETNPISEDTSTRSKRFSKRVEIDESELRQNKQGNA